MVNYHPDKLGLYGRIFQLETPEKYFKTQIERLKAQMVSGVKKLNMLNSLKLAQENSLEKLKREYLTNDRKLAFRDGRLKVCKPHLKPTNHKMPPIVKHRIDKKGLKQALSLMSVADKEELLKDLLR